MANVKINTTNTTGGYPEPVNPNTTGALAGGFYPQNASSNDGNAGIERDSSGNLVLKDATAGTLTLSTVYNGRPATVDVFTSSSGTYNKPAGATVARVLLMGGGGGGASGSTGANNTNRNGGGGGGTGQFIDTTISLAQITTGITVVVGAGGVGATGTAGIVGGAGGSTTFGTAGDAFYLEARGGTSSPSPANGGAGWASTVYGVSGTPAVALSTGAASSFTATPQASLAGFSSGGGAGGGVNNTGVERAGGNGGVAPITGLLYLSRGQQATASTGGAIATNGNAGNTTSAGLGVNASVYFGSGGSGGGGSGTATPGNGGAAAANTGAGGGGGGAGTTPLFGNGGDGGSGWAVIISW